jgi:hypothetical protein
MRSTEQNAEPAARDTLIQTLSRLVLELMGLCQHHASSGEVPEISQCGHTVRTQAELARALTGMADEYPALKHLPLPLLAEACMLSLWQVLAELSGECRPCAVASVNYVSTLTALAGWGPGHA